MISLNNLLFKNIPHVGSFWYFVLCCICVFVHFVIVFFVFVRSANGNIIFDILEQSPFQKYITCWVFLALCHMLYLCIFVFVYLYLCICDFANRNDSGQTYFLNYLYSTNNSKRGSKGDLEIDSKLITCLALSEEMVCWFSPTKLDLG